MDGMEVPSRKPFDMPYLIISYYYNYCYIFIMQFIIISMCLFYLTFLTSSYNMNVFML